MWTIHVTLKMEATHSSTLCYLSVVYSGDHITC